MILNTINYNARCMYTINGASSQSIQENGKSYSTISPRSASSFSVPDSKVSIAGVMCVIAPRY